MAVGCRDSLAFDHLPCPVLPADPVPGLDLAPCLCPSPDPDLGLRLHPAPSPGSSIVIGFGSPSSGPPLGPGLCHLIPPHSAWRCSVLTGLAPDLWPAPEHPGVLCYQVALFSSV